MKKIPKRSLSISLELQNKVKNFSEIIKQNISDQKVLDSLFNTIKNLEIIKLILSKKIKTETEIFIIKTYLNNLHNFISVIKENKDEEINIDSLLNKMAQDLKCENFKENSFLMKVGEIGKTFYVILSGSVEILVPKQIEVYMTKNEYINHLKLLNLYYENYLLEKTLSLNNEILIIEKEKYFIEENKKTYCEIKMTLEEYLNKINEIEYQKENKEKINIKIMGYYKVLTLKIGNTFGDYALINENSLRTASIFAKENSFFGTLSKNSFQNSIKFLHERITHSDINFIYNTKLFEQITLQYLTSHYWNFFIKKRIKKDELLFEYNHNIEDIIFFYQGEVTLLIPNLTCKKINQLINQINNNNIIYDQNDYNDKPNDTILKYVKKGDILGMNDIIVNKKFICNAICKSEKAIYFSINIKIFNWILSHYNLAFKNWKKLEKANINFVIERLNIIKNYRNKGLIKNIRDENKRIDFEIINHENNEKKNNSIEFIKKESNLFNLIKKNFSQPKDIKLKKRGSQIYTQKINLIANHQIKKRNSVILPKISSMLHLNKEDFLKNINNNNLSSSSFTSSSSSSSSSKSLISKKNISTNYIKTQTNKNLLLKNLSGKITIKINNDNKNKSKSLNKINSKESVIPQKRQISFQNLYNNNNSKKNIKLHKNYLSYKKIIKTNVHKFKFIKPNISIQIKNSRNINKKKYSFNTDYETKEFEKRIKFNDPISNILVSSQNEKLKKNYLESKLFQTLNLKKNAKKIKLNSFNNNNTFKFSISPNKKLSNVPSNFWNNSKNNKMKKFMNEIFG